MSISRNSHAACGPELPTCEGTVGRERVMGSKIAGSILGLALVVVTSGLAGAATIVGPNLPGLSNGFEVTGLEFKALTDSTLTGFTFQNRGKADTVVLTDANGNY
jgi:hypothetical protein